VRGPESNGQYPIRQLILLTTPFDKPKIVLKKCCKDTAYFHEIKNKYPIN